MAVAVVGAGAGMTGVAPADGRAHVDRGEMAQQEQAGSANRYGVEGEPSPEPNEPMARPLPPSLSSSASSTASGGGGASSCGVDAELPDSGSALHPVSERGPSAIVRATSPSDGRSSSRA